MKILNELTFRPPGRTGRTSSRSTTRSCLTTRLPTCPSRGSGTLSETEATNLRNYLLKGGFIIFDDFRS